MIFRVFKFVLDFFVIVFSVSLYNTILPYIIYDTLNPFPLFYLVHGFLCLLILFLRFKNIFLPKKILSFRPFLFLFILLVFQLFSSIALQDFNAIVLVLIFFFFTFIFITYIFNIYAESFSNSSEKKIFLNLNRHYIFFILLNTSLIIISLLLLNLNILEPYTNDINNLFTNLFYDNTVNGYTEYYMPGWLSIQTPDDRLGIGFGTLLGLTHEPHVLNFMSIPMYFLLLSYYSEKKYILNFLLIIFAIITIINFSGTTGICLLIIIGVNMIINRSFKLLILYLMGSITVYYLFITGYFEAIQIFYELKSSASETSFDYSFSRIYSIIIPDSFIGDGVLLLSDQNIKSGGLFTSLFYISFYLSLFYEISKLLYSKNKHIKIYGFGLLYFTLHSFKMSGKIFIMPLTIYFITVYFILSYYIIPLVNKKKHENIKSY